MTRVNINGHDHQVEIQAPDDAPLDEVVTAARNLWQETLQPERKPGPASGGQLTERSHRTTGFSRHMGQGEQPAVTSRHDKPEEAS